MAIDRLERILYKLAQRHAPHLTPAGWLQQADKLGRLHKLARDLARYGVLTMLGNVSIPKAIDVQVEAWVNLHAQFYHLLARTLFPTFSNIQAQYADKLTPPVVVLIGDGTPVLNVMAGTLLPYLAMRQPQANDVTDVELHKLMDVILRDLEAGDLPPVVYEDLQHQCAEVVRQLLKGDVTHIMLTLFDKPILDEIIATKPKHTPPKPTALPKTGRLNPTYGESPPSDALQRPFELDHLPDDQTDQAPTREMFIEGILIDKSRKRILPLPDLPPHSPKKDGDNP